MGDGWGSVVMGWEWDGNCQKWMEWERWEMGDSSTEKAKNRRVLVPLGTKTNRNSLGPPLTKVRWPIREAF
jgi:hypothetical protein